MVTSWGDDVIPNRFLKLKIWELQVAASLTPLSPSLSHPHLSHILASRYIIRISTNIVDLRDKFNTSVQVNTTNLIPKEANSEETFEFELEDGSFGNGTDIFIAIQAVDKSNLKSEISNIARVSLFIPTEEQSTSKDTAPLCPDVSINSTIPGIHVLKIMWKWLGEMQVTLGLHWIFRR